MLIDCPTCSARVHAKVIAERVYPSDDYSDPYKYLFLECPSCENVLLGLSDWAELGPNGEQDWANPVRLWPDPYLSYDTNVPKLVKSSIEDARKCYHAGVYTACAVMCGRALEAICIEKTNEKTLYKGLKQLREADIIDDKLYKWGEALRKERNIGAHATEETVYRDDAKDILDFATTIIEYIYIMSAKFEKYMKRK